MESEKYPGDESLYILLYRPDSRRAWQTVATGKTYRACLDQIGIGGRRGGQWRISQPSVAQPRDSRNTLAAQDLEAPEDRGSSLVSGAAPS